VRRRARAGGALPAAYARGGWWYSWWYKGVCTSFFFGARPNQRQGSAASGTAGKKEEIWGRQKRCAWWACARSDGLWATTGPGPGPWTDMGIKPCHHCAHMRQGIHEGECVGRPPLHEGARRRRRRGVEGGRSHRRRGLWAGPSAEQALQHALAGDAIVGLVGIVLGGRLGRATRGRPGTGRLACGRRGRGRRSGGAGSLLEQRRGSRGGLRGGDRDGGERGDLQGFPRPVLLRPDPT
jgi:hypothetical protein